MLGTVDTCDEKPTPLSDGSYNPLNLRKHLGRHGHDVKRVIIHGLSAIDREGHYVPVPEVCARVLRPHQREGVAFMFACLLGLSDYPKEVAEIVDTTKANGCILADDMGLGKTLQSIAVMWTLLQSFDGQNKRLAEKVLVVCPASLVGNWSAELDKWLKGACRHTAVNDGVRSKVLAKLEGFKYDRVSKVLIVSYEAVRMHLKLIKNKLKFDLIIADEAHRLKNSESGISSAIASMDCRKRLLLTGTPLQNDLNEFFILGALANPVIFTDDKSRKNYVNPILAGINPDATDKEITFAKDKLSTLAKITNAFVLRRSNVLLRTVLPDKVVAYVFCSLSPVQIKLYAGLIALVSSLADAKRLGGVLSLIQLLCKVCTHPFLVPLSSLSEDMAGEWRRVVEGCGFGGALAGALASGGSRSNSGGGRMVTRGSRENSRCMVENVGSLSTGHCVGLSGKFLFLYSLIEAVKCVGDRLVVVSNFTQTLDLVGEYCQLSGVSAVRLDGKTSIKKRQEKLHSFNVLGDGLVFLLSSKAGGAGINLVGANRLVLMDADWNPANDKQALARIWRDGQQKTCVIYRLFSSGTIEEKILQRQLAKDLVSNIVLNPKDLKTGISQDTLRTLFQFDPQHLPDCDTHQVLQCARCDTTTNAQQLIGDSFNENGKQTPLFCA